MLKVVITIDNTVDVDFAIGTWSRANIDTAYRAMYRELPNHIRNIKKEDQANESGKRKSRAKSGE